MSRRFEYAPITGKKFRGALGNLGMKSQTFARITGAKLDTVKKWLHDGQTIPPWVPLVLELLTLPGALSLARQVAAEYIILDRETGEKDPFIDDSPDDGGTEKEPA